MLTATITQSVLRDWVLISTATRKMFTRARGRRNFQAKAMNWSTLSRGRVPRIQKMTKKRANTFIRNQRKGGRMGPFHPPRNREAPMAEAARVGEYSPRE